jgi:hypothetical protein
MDLDRSEQEKGKEMDVIRDDMGPRRTGEATHGRGALHHEMAATGRALSAADNAEVHAAMDSVRWKRLGLLQRLTRSVDS